MTITRYSSVMNGRARSEKRNKNGQRKYLRFSALVRYEAAPNISQEKTL